VTRLPIRLRLALVFALVMAIVLGAVGAVLYVRLGASLDERIDESLQSGADTLAALVRDDAGDLGDSGPILATGEDGFSQILTLDGVVLLESPGLDAEPLLSASELAGVRGRVTRERELALPAGADESRLLAERVETGDGAVVVVVGESLEDRDEALDQLLAQLLLILPVALALSSAAGYVVAGAALRPVDAMRRQAAQVSAETPERRLPLSAADDEIRRLGETLNEMLERLDAGLRRERRFVADASHELRTPLATLKAELELALRRPRSAEELRASLRSAGEDVERLERLAEDLLALAASDEDRLARTRMRHSVQELLESVASRYERRAQSAGRSVVVVAGARGAVVGDRRRLEQALGNLVDNALRHGAGAVRLEAASENGSVALRVSDEGPGFSAAFLPHAFERFSRADSARSGTGAGLGLAIVDAVARAHGGSAQATNRPGGGAEITLRIPADDESASGTHRALI
jgi:two-component system OmpR family sensor kinase